MQDLNYDLIRYMLKNRREELKRSYQLGREDRRHMRELAAKIRERVAGFWRPEMVEARERLR